MNLTQKYWKEKKYWCIKENKEPGDAWQLFSSL